MGALAGAAVNLGMQAAGNLVNGATGAIFGGMNDRRQLKQQGKLQALQMQGQKEMTDYNQQKQLELWEKTGYGAQMKQIEEAGLNAGLLYGQGGGGGLTAQIAQGQVSGGEAPKGGNEILGMAQANNLALQQAQIEVMKSQAEKNKAEATKTAGVDTQLAGKQVESLITGITNTEAKTAMTRVQTRIEELRENIIDNTLEETIAKVEYESERAGYEMKQARYASYVDSKVMKEKVRIVQEELIGIMVKNALTRAQTENTVQGTAESKSRVMVNSNNIKNSVQQLMIEWEKLSQTDKELRLKTMLAEHNTDPTTDILRGLTQGIGTVIHNTTSPLNK